MKPKQHITDIIFMLSLFCVFAVLALLVVVLGANVYQKISGGMEENYQARSSVTYLTEKIRQNDVQNGISVQEVAGEDALVLTRTVQERTYETWIYFYENSLYEVTVLAGSAVSPGNGQAVTSLSGLHISREGSRIIEITATDLHGRSFHSSVSLQSGSGGEE